MQGTDTLTTKSHAAYLRQLDPMLIRVLPRVGSVLEQSAANRFGCGNKMKTGLLQPLYHFYFYIFF